MNKYIIKERPQIDTIQDLLEKSSVEFGSRIALRKRAKEGYNEITHKEVGEYANSISYYLHFLKGIGIHKEIGDRVALLSENRPEFSLSFLGVMNCGATLVPIDKELSQEQIENVLKHSMPKAIIVSEKQAGKIRRIRAALPKLELIVMSEDAEKDEIPFSKLLSYTKKTFKIKIPKEHVAEIVYTSGTTGIPKGVMLTHYNIVYDITAAFQMFDVNENDRFLSIMPPNHTYDSTANLLGPLISGGSLTYGGDLLNEEDLKMLPIILKETKPTIFLAVPRVYEMFYKGIMKKIKADWKKRTAVKTDMFFSRLLNKINISADPLRIKKKIKKEIGFSEAKMLVNGAAALPEDLRQNFLSLGIEILPGYGITEASPITHINPKGKVMPFSSGVAIPGLEHRILEPDEKGVGEILMKGPNIMKGYYLNKEATENAFIDEWFRTGDYGYIEGDYIYVLGRLKHQIKTRGGKLADCDTIEQAFKDFSCIDGIAIVPLPDGKGSETVHAIIKPKKEFIYELQKKNPALTEGDVEAAIRKEIDSYTKGKLSSFEKPTSIELTDMQIPKTTTLKTQHSFMHPGEQTFSIEKLLNEK